MSGRAGDGMRHGGSCSTRDACRAAQYDRGMSDLEAARRATSSSIWRCLELAHAALLAGGLPVGAVVVGDDDMIMSEGRNRAYDPPTGADPPEGTPLAHAEMNAMARLAVATPLESMTLWSTHQPCAMCAAAASFIGLSHVEAIAADPSDPENYVRTGVASPWVVLATSMFLVGRIQRRGPNDPAIEANAPLEPEAVRFALEVARLPRHPLTDNRTLDAALTSMWPGLSAAARNRDDRLA